MNKIYPQRLQRKRVKGFKVISPNGLKNKYVNRPSKFSNPYKIGDTYKSDDGQVEMRIDNELACILFAKYLDKNPDLVIQIKKELKNFNIVCFCSLDKICHGDILIELANNTIY